MNHLTDHTKFTINISPTQFPLISITLVLWASDHSNATSQRRVGAAGGLVMEGMLKWREIVVLANCN